MCPTASPATDKVMDRKTLDGRAPHRAEDEAGPVVGYATLACRVRNRRRAILQKTLIDAIC